jgi:hypothetical protein
MKQQHRRYVAATGTHQGLVIEEGTGRSVAVTYDKEDAPLAAAAPELLAALERIVAAYDDARSGDMQGCGRNAIARATEV